MYDACVWSTLTYAIITVGLGVSEVRMVHQLVSRHLSYIAHSARHITKESNEALCTRLGRRLPLEALRCLWESKQRAWMDLVQQAPQYPDLTPALTMQMHAGPTMTASASSHAWHCHMQERLPPGGPVHRPQTRSGTDQPMRVVRPFGVAGHCKFGTVQPFCTCQDD